MRIIRTAIVATACAAMFQCAYALDKSDADAEYWAFRKAMARPSGGMLMPNIKSNVITIRNLQTKYSAEELKDTITLIRKQFSFLFSIAEKGETVANQKVEVVLTDDPVFADAKMVVVPEQDRAWLSVGWLLDHGPSKTTRARRLRLALLRAVASAFGAGAPGNPPCFMVPVFSVDDLDALATEHACPEVTNVIEERARRLGIKHVRPVSYRKACKEGWAPAPTNDIQKAIWDEVRKIPDKPIKIEFDKNAGK